MFLHMPYTYNKITGLDLCMACIKLPMSPGGLPTTLLKSYALIFQN